LTLVAVTLFFVSAEGFAKVFAADEAVKCRLKADPLITGGASFFVPGLGQFFNGQDGKGFVHFIVAIGLPTAIYFSAAMVAAVSPLTGVMMGYAASLVYLGWAVYSAFDAYGIASEHCRA
jgi:TM2 domain-containing membrane protein YozV